MINNPTAFAALQQIRRVLDQAANLDNDSKRQLLQAVHLEADKRLQAMTIPRANDLARLAAEIRAPQPPRQTGYDV